MADAVCTISLYFASFIGLNVEVDRILEIACIITDGKLTKLIEVLLSYPLRNYVSIEFMFLCFLFWYLPLLTSFFPSFFSFPLATSFSYCLNVYGTMPLS